MGLVVVIFEDGEVTSMSGVVWFVAVEATELGQKAAEVRLGPVAWGVLGGLGLAQAL